MKRLRKLFVVLVLFLSLVPINSQGAMLLGMLLRMFREHLDNTQIPVLYQSTCETQDGVNIVSKGGISYERGNFLYPDNMRLTLYLGEKDKENFMKNYLDLSFDEVSHRSNGDVILRKNNKVTEGEYVQVCAKTNGEVVVSAFYKGKYSDALYYKLDLSEAKNKERYAKFIHSEKTPETIKHENFVRKELQKRGLTLKDYYKDEDLRNEINSLEMKEELDDLNHEEQEYRELLKKEAQEAAPKFGLG